MHLTNTLLLLLASSLQPHAHPISSDLTAQVSKRQGWFSLPELLLTAIVDGGGPAVDAFGLGAQIAKELFGDLMQDEHCGDTSNCRMEIDTDSSCTIKTWGKGDLGDGHTYTPSTCAFGTPITYTDPVLGDYTLNFQTTDCPNSNKCNPIVSFTSHWFANGTQTGIQLDFSADDDDHDFYLSGKTFLCAAGYHGASYWLCAVPCGQIQPNGLGYAPGQCGVHVVQYQKNEGPNAVSGGTGNTNYRFDVTISDANGNQIGQTVGADGPLGVGVDVDSKLPWVVEVYAGNVDSDLLNFAYSTQSWSSECSYGGYDSGSRQIDCGFSC